MKTASIILLVAVAFGGALRAADTPSSPTPTPDDNGLSRRVFSARPAVDAGTPMMDTRTDAKAIAAAQASVDVKSLVTQPDLPSNVPFTFVTLQSTDNNRSLSLVPTYLEVKQSYKATFDTYHYQLFDMTVPVYYDDRFLLLSPQDQQLKEQLEKELKELVVQITATTERAEALSKDLNALYARGRPFKLLNGYTPETSYQDPYGGQPVDAQDKMPVGVKVSGVAAGQFVPVK